MTAAPWPKTLSIMPTWRCTAACTDCGTLSTPRVKTALDHATVLSAIRQAPEGGYSVVVFTGGEPTLAGDFLLEAISYARALNLSTRVVTNAHWAVDANRAKTITDRFRTAGLDEINYSTGDQHVRFVPVTRVLTAIDAAVRSGLSVAVMIETRAERSVTRDAIVESPEYRALLREFPTVHVSVHESPWMPLDPLRTDRYASGHTANRHNVSLRSGCDSVLSTTTLQADGTIGACCGIGMRLIPELQVGHIDQMTLSEADEGARRDFLKRWIRVEGPERILAWAATKDASIQWEDYYAHRCQACIRLYTDDRIRQVIREHHKEKVPDVVLGEWMVWHSHGDSTD